jgi:hypothetical protein
MSLETLEQVELVVAEMEKTKLIAFLQMMEQTVLAEAQEEATFLLKAEALMAEMA